MKKDLEELLKNEAIKHYIGADSAHDIQHAFRVLKNVKLIMKSEGGDPDILIPASLFHDVVCFPKESLQLA